MQVNTKKNDKVQLYPKRANINKNQNPDHIHTFKMCTNSQPNIQTVGGVIWKCIAPLMQVNRRIVICFFKIKDGGRHPGLLLKAIKQTTMSCLQNFRFFSLSACHI